MKTIEEMIATYTPEEWRKIIKNEMDELGLCFSEDTEYQKASLFEADLNEAGGDVHESQMWELQILQWKSQENK